MGHDYYAFRQAQLKDTFGDLEQAAGQVEHAKKQRDRQARENAENKLEQTALKILKIEPHLAYLWYEANSSELRNSIRDAWRKSLAASSIPDAFRFTPRNLDIGEMPQLSLLIHVPFRLQTPYLSKDECAFHVLDNPLRREKIFRTPMVASTSWKGSMRGAMVQQLASWWSRLNAESKNERTSRKEFVAKRLQLGRFFGTERDVEVNDRRCEQYLDKLGGNHLARWYRRYVRRFVSSTGFFAGRLHFYSTFFTRAGMEVINPHNRQTGVGERPILMECVPKDTLGDFFVLYVPFGPIEQNEAQRSPVVAQDLEVLTLGIQAMLTIYGFGAKTSSGFGAVEDKLASKGTLALRIELPGLAASTGTESQLTQPAPNLARYLESLTRLHDDFRQSDNSLKSESEYRTLVNSRGKQYGKDEKQLYAKAQKWWEREGRQLAEAAAQQPAPETPSAQVPPVTTIQFDTLSRLVDKGKEVAAHLRSGAEV